jgi:hypothetical protein
MPDRQRADPRDDATYWDELAGRVSSFAALAAKQSALDWLAEPRVRVTVACALLAAALALTMRTSSTSSPGTLEVWTQALAPSDQIGQAILLSGRPPAIGALLLSEQGGRAR